MLTSRITSLFFLLCCTTLCMAQLSQPQLNAEVDKYTQALTRKGIDTVCVYEQYCTGCFFYSEKNKDLCAEKISFLPTYIFWKEKGKTFMTKKDACYDYSVQPVPNDSFWLFYFANKDKIKKEELKQPEYIEKLNGKSKTVSVKIDQAVYFRIKIKAATDQLNKEINNFYFTRELGANEELNINYDYNQQTSLNGLHSILQRIVKVEKEKRLLVKTLR